MTCLMLDVDGVLISGRPNDGKHWTLSLEADLGIAPATLVEAFFNREWRDVVKGHRDLFDALRESLLRIETKVSAEDLVSYWFEMDSKINPKVLEDCKKVREKGVLVYLATNQEHHRARFLMQDLGLANEVDGIIYSAQIGAQKPNPRFFAQAEKATGRRKKNHFLIDDTSANVEAAIAAGWKAAHWTGDQTIFELIEELCSQISNTI
ncbi:MAG: HAD-IA family hydrolase [Pseudomonadota bacterium]